MTKALDANMIINVAKAVNETFNEADWLELGLRTGKSDLVRGHHRLLRSLSWGDPDYYQHVIDVVSEICEKSDDALPHFLAFGKIQTWFNENEVSLKDGVPLLDNAKNPWGETFIFRRRPPKIIKGVCFLMMPFREKWSGRTLNAITNILKEFKITVKRADDLYGDVIIEDIWNYVHDSEIIIADLTTRNPNVFYELALCHSIGRSPILITQDDSDATPFDIHHLRHIKYEDNTDGILMLKNGLHGVLKSRGLDDIPF